LHEELLVLANVSTVAYASHLRDYAKYLQEIRSLMKWTEMLSVFYWQ